MHREKNHADGTSPKNGAEKRLENHQKADRDN
jgi:hypothetical protein